MRSERRVIAKSTGNGRWRQSGDCGRLRNGKKIGKQTNEGDTHAFAGVRVH